MKPNNPSSSAVQDIVVARCENLTEAQAMARWILPVLCEWPQSAWHLWLADATDCSAIRAAKLSEEDDRLVWQPVEHEAGAPHDTLTNLLGGHVGIVVLAHHVIAAAAHRHLDGLVSQVISFPANDPLAKPFAKPLAAYGIRLAA